ncbi:protein of unknown function [Oenococcus oeni]|nr:protein of unknown function [Oenococcus oeni]
MENYSWLTVLFEDSNGGVIFKPFLFIAEFRKDWKKDNCHLTF